MTVGWRLGIARTRILAVAGALAAAGTLSGATFATSGATASACATGHASGGAAAKVAKGAHLPGIDAISKARATAMDKKVAATAKRNNGRGIATTVINVRAHIIQGTGDNGLSSVGLRDSLRQLNKAYAGVEPGTPGGAVTRFSYKLYSVDKTRNDTWFRGINPNNPSNDRYTKQMKQALHVGGARSLNLYFVKFRGGLLGFATFPDEYSSHKKLDGVVVDYRTAPGGTYTPYDEGDTATHEVGHWLGLRHVFSDFGGASACTVDNDSIDDTPIQAEPSAGCPVGADTCPQTGVDNIHNYMDYSVDSCMYLFTPGQAKYMSDAYDTFRAVG